MKKFLLGLLIMSLFLPHKFAGSEMYALRINKNQKITLIDNLMSKFKNIHRIKKENVKKRKKRTISQIDICSRKVGEILITMDNKTAGFRHGHAGIAGCASGTVIEANPETGVKVLTDRFKTYWNSTNLKTGGRYRVARVPQSSYYNAEKWAKNMLGIPYGVSPGSSLSSMYCSELVYRSWFAAGVRIGSTMGEAYWYGGFITPTQIVNDEDTYLVESYE